MPQTENYLGNLTIEYIHCVEAYHTPRFNTVGSWVYILISHCLSVCLWTESCPLCIFHKTCQIHFISYTSCQATSESVSHANLSKILKIRIFGKFLKFHFVLFWLGIWYESIVWVIMGWRGVFPEGRHCNCSTSFLFFLQIRLNAKNVTIKNLFLSEPEFDGQPYPEVYQLCICAANGKLFVAPSRGNCQATNTVCN